MVQFLPTNDETLFSLLDRAITNTRIRFILPDGTREIGRSADASGEPDFILRVTDTNFSRRILTSGNLGLAESWMEEGWQLERGTLDALLTVFALSAMDERLLSDPRVLVKVAAMRVQHAFSSAHDNVQLHYDVGNDVYELFLDETMGYTCGYQTAEGESLQKLQENKYDRICQKVRLQPGHTVLDIGCGWGGLIIHAAKHYGAKATGITICKNQAEWAMRRARALGLEDRVKVEFGDFREAKGVYDRIVSVGMFEHLYQHEHRTYFKHVNKLLKDDGMGLVHFMGCVKGHNNPDPFVQKYIFPGSTHPHPSSAIRQLEKNDLALLDVENIGRHYLPTARHWWANWNANKHRIDSSKYDARFVRMYDYLLALYVAGCDALVGGLFQILFTKDFRKNLPVYRV
ncbi:MAG: class I SAM-dependent methyltransferase [Myxococcales bacterium]|nr:class I SAM-dependent methyltransferase [Myxococcales bacterium]